MTIPEEFFDVQFGKAVAFGYKTEDVDEFVTKAIQIIRELNEENRVLEDKMRVLAQTVEKYREDEESLRSALIGAQKLGDSILKDSRSKAEIILRDATIKAEHIVEDAHKRLEIETAELERVKTEASSFKEELIAMYKSHIGAIKRLPSQELERRYEETHSEEGIKEEGSVQIADEARQIELPTEPAPEPIQTKKPENLEERTRPAPQAQPAQTARIHEAGRRQPVLPRIKLDLMEDDEAEEDSPAVADFHSKVDKLLTLEEQKKHFAFDDDEDEELEFVSTSTGDSKKKTVVSSKFGVLKFGDSFALEDD